VDDTVLAIYAAASACSGLQEISGECDDDSCTSEAAQAVLSGVGLTAGTNYYIVAWQYGASPPAPGNTAVQLRVSRIGAPPNDTCSGAAALLLNHPVAGTTVSAFDDTRLPAGSACFTGVGQATSTAPGNEVVYRFMAPDAGRYSLRLSGYDPSRNAVLYVASDCPGGGPPAEVSGCLGAANRTPSAPEEVTCVPLAAGQSVFVYVDEDTSTSGSAFTLEASRCVAEEEPNATPALAGEPECGLEGSIAPAGDADFFSLGTLAPGSRVFALVEGAAANSGDFDLRVTTDNGTLEYDDTNNDTPFGSAAPNVAGTRLNGTAAYLRVSHYSPAAQAEPYRLYASVQPPASSATPEAEPDNTVATATGGANEYYSGTLSGTGDVDIFSFTAVAGEMIQIGLDLDPARDNTPFNGSLALLDGSGTTLLLVNDPSLSSSNAPGTGSLTATTPYSPAEGMVYRVRTSGVYYAKVAWSAGAPGDYLLSISDDCRVLPATDLAVSQSDSPDPAAPGGAVSYAIIVRNLGVHSATGVTLRDDLPAGSTLVSAIPAQGSCAGAGPVICHLADLAPGGETAVNVAVSTPQATGTLLNSARASTASVDADPSNDASTESTSVGIADSDGDGVPDVSDCSPGNAAVWAVPGEATGLSFPNVADDSLLQWLAPASPGGTVLHFDLLRSAAAADFGSSLCLASGTTSTNASDSALPGSVFFYLVRSENVCGGNLGTRSDGTSRLGGACP
jgi:uncharacterized repeat protein (TIGR01451 family)